MSAFVRRFAAWAVLLGALALARGARADRIAVLPFAASGGRTTSAELDEARKSTRAAVQSLKHTLPTDSEMLTAKMAVPDGVADTSAEYRAAGRASGSQWTVAGHVDAHAGTYRLELEACQIESGRVESLAREVDARQATPQIAEMLALLLRPEGIGTTEAPWEHTGPAKPAAAAPPPPAAPTPPALPPPPPPPAPAPPPVNEPPPRAYAEGFPMSVGLGIGPLFALKRAGNARGSGTAGLVDVSFGYAIESVRGLEVRADAAFGALGPQSIRAEAGLRYLFPLAPRAHVFAGPEATLGGFFALGGDQSARLLVRGGLPIAWAPTERFQLELVPEIDAALGGTTTLLLAGGIVRGAYRF